MKIKKIKLIQCFKLSFLIFFFLFFIKGEICAQVGLSVSPQKFDLVLFPGDDYQGQFKIGNQSAFPLPISIKALPFGAEEGSGEMRFEEIDPDSPSLWFEFELSEMILTPGEIRRINFKTSIPSDVQPGGYYIFVYFEPRFPDYYLENMGPKTIPIIGVPFLISTTPLLIDPEEGANFAFVEFLISEEERIRGFEKLFQGLASIGQVYAAQPEVIISRTKPSSFRIRIKNNDIYHIRPIGNLFLYNGFGIKVAEAELKGSTILPGKSRDFEINLIEEGSSIKSQVLNFLSLGRYRAELDILAISPVREELLPIGGNSSISFFSLKIFYFLIIITIIILLIYFARKRIIIALRFLIKNK